MSVPFPPICAHCVWLTRTSPVPLKLDGSDSCGAFPDGIPQPILDNEVDHRKPVDGDQGIRFEPRSENSRLYAEIVFDED